MLKVLKFLIIKLRFTPTLIFLAVGTQVNANNRSWVLVHSIVEEGVDEGYEKRGSFYGNTLFADYYFDSLTSCKDALNDRMLWKLSDAETKLLEYDIDGSQPEFITTWRDGNLFNTSKCISVFKK